MSSCTHASFCGKRMALGDRENGCNDVDERACHPTLTVKGITPTAPAGPEQQPYRKCSNCYRRITKAQWQAAHAKPLCECGCWSWIEL